MSERGFRLPPYAGWIAIGAVGIAILLVWSLLPVEAWLRAFVAWIDRLGPAGVLAFAIALTIGTLLLAPGSVMGIAAGLAYGYWGLPLVLASCGIGAGAAFLIARHLARRQVVEALAGRPKLKAVADAVDDSGWKLLALLRLSVPVPFALTNYVFGVTRIGFWPFLLTTLVGMIPAAFVWINVGALGQAAAGEGEASTLQWALFALGTAAAIATGVIVTKKTREALQAHAASAPRRPP